MYSRTKVHAYGTTHMISLTLISNRGKQDTNFPNKRKMHCHRVKITSKTNFKYGNFPEIQIFLLAWINQRLKLGSARDNLTDLFNLHHAQWRHLIGTVSLFWRHPDLKHNPSEPCCTISTFETLWTPRQSQEDVKI